MVEADQHDGGAGVASGGLCDLEHRAVAVRPASCRTEQVAVGVYDEAAVQTGTVGVVEAYQSDRGAGVAVGRIGNFEHRAGTVRTRTGHRWRQRPGFPLARDLRDLRGGN